MQGKEAEHRISEPPPRITPACAGKRLQTAISTPATQDHPCVCREKKRIGIILANRTGSPLRVQGKASDEKAETVRSRITPACAGKSFGRKG